MKKTRILLAAAGAALALLPAASSRASTSSSPQPYPAVLDGHHPFVALYNPAQLVAPQWITAPYSGAPASECNSNPVSEVSGYAHVPTTGQEGSCSAIESPSALPVTAGYVYEAEVYVSSYSDWPSVWMYGGNYGTSSYQEMDALEANFGVNAATWHSGSNCADSTWWIDYHDGCDHYRIKTTAPNVLPGKWNVIDMAYGGNYLQVYYNGKLFATIPSNSSVPLLHTPMYLVFSDGSCASAAYNSCANGKTSGPAGFMAIKWLRVFK